jgi:hypothetical protein
MDNMVRKQIYLEKRQVKAVKKRAEILGLNESELIRRAIDRALFGAEAMVSPPDPAVWDEIAESIHSRSDTSKGGKPYQFNREDAYSERLDRYYGSDSD